MSKQPEDKEALSKQLDELKKDLADFEADRSLDKDARIRIANAAKECIKEIEKQLAKL